MAPILYGIRGDAFVPQTDELLDGLAGLEMREDCVSRS